MRRLLTATCLTAVSANAAQATLVTESTDFGNSFAERTLLPVGTDVVTGVVGPSSDPDDFFQLSGLTPLAPFNVDFLGSVTNLDVGGEVLDSSGASFGIGGFHTVPLDISGTVPADGILVLRTFYSEGGPYQVTTTVIPEPATSTLLTLGLGALGWRRRKHER